MKLQELTIDRYDEVLALMQRTPGIAVRDADAKASMARYLARNPGLSFVAEAEGRIVGCALCGHDGRRGYLQHVAVEPAFRRRGVAQDLVNHCLAALEKEGIRKVHLDVLVANDAAKTYWQRRGWTLRDDILRFSFIRGSSENA